MDSESHRRFSSFPEKRDYLFIASDVMCPLPGSRLDRHWLLERSVALCDPGSVFVD
jgi:hypothetical protein